MAIEKDLLDQLLAGRDPKDVFNKDGLVDELKKALSERILNAEIDEHLDGDGGEAKGNHRNGLFEEVGSDWHFEDDIAGAARSCWDLRSEGRLKYYRLHCNAMLGRRCRLRRR